MASNDLEVLDPAAPVESVMESKSGHELDRRGFFTALGVAGIAAGAAILSKSADAQQPSNPNGYAQVDVINFLLNIKYLKATLYSFITQGADLPASSFVTEGTGVVLNQPAKITFSSQQITDIFNEMYYDELNQLIALRAQQGVAVANRQTINLLGTGPSGSPSGTATTTTLTQAQAIALCRMLEDLSASAFAAATTYLTGTNLQLVAQSLASDGQHAGMIRLLAIQNGVQYQGTQYASVTTSNTAQAAVTFTGQTIAGSSQVYVNLGTNLPTVGQIVNGIGIAPGAGGVITNVTSKATTTFTAVPVKSASSLVFASSAISSLAATGGQPVTGTYVPAGSYTTSGGIGTNTVALSTAGAAAVLSGSATVAPTGFVTSGSPTITGVSSLTGVIVGETITGTGIPTSPPTTITAASGTTITMSANATATSVLTVTGNLTTGSATVANLSTLTGLSVGQVISGAGIPTGTTITNIPTSNTLTMSANATATATGVSITTPATEAVTTPTADTYTVTQSTITLAQPATLTGFNTFYIVIPDSTDVEPGDPGVAATSAGGPSAISGTSPTMYQGFFNTAGSGTATANTPAGFAFAKTFQQVLAVLYGYNATNSTFATQNYEGGFFPVGVSGPINSVT